MNAAFLLCLLFVSPDQKLVDITVYQGTDALQSMQLERTPKGLDMYFLKGQQRRKVAAFLVKDDPFFFVADLEGIEGEPEQFDLRQARQGVRPWDSKTEKQELQALGKRIVAVRQGQTIAVTFDGASETFVTQLAAAPPPATATAPASASRPGATWQPASTPSSRPAGRTGRTRIRPEPPSRPARPASAIAPASSPSTSAPASRPAIRTPAVDAAASDPTRQKNVLRTIAEFFDALAGGEASAMGPCYADSVTIAKGSTLLEEQLGLDCKLSDNGDGLARRQDLLDAYAALVTSKGKAQWLKGFYSAGGHQSVPAILPVESDGQAIAGSRQGDMAVEVKAFGKKSTYLFRRQESGAWLIVLEQSKY